MTGPSLLSRAVRLLGQFWSPVRRGCWGAGDRVSVHPSARVARTAELQFARGGTITIGANVEIEHGALLAPYGGSIEIGDNVYIGPYCVLYGHGGLTIGRDSMIASHCVLIPSQHRFDSQRVPIHSQGCSSRGIAVGRDVWLGAGVRVLDGVEIGDGCVIGAGAVVTRAIPSFAVATGVPARVARLRGQGQST